MECLKSSQQQRFFLHLRKRYIQITVTVKHFSKRNCMILMFKPKLCSKTTPGVEFRVLATVDTLYGVVFPVQMSNEYWSNLLLESSQQQWFFLHLRKHYTQIITILLVQCLLCNLHVQCVLRQFKYQQFCFLLLGY